MRKTAWAVLAVIILAAAAGLAADQPRIGPPPLRTEAPTLQPSQNHVWIPGYWKWGGINYEWVEGRWVKAKKDKVWVPGTWEQVGARWVWKAGKWEKIPKGKPKDAKPPKAEGPEPRK
jgi:hypothetical protein